MHGLDLTYNHLNLIQNVKQDGTALANYSYLADGTKLSATDGADNGLLYRGSLVYKREAGNLTLESAGVAAGRIIATATSQGIDYQPHYFISDHLGSVRVILNGAGSVLERNNYYPYGMRWNEGQISGNNRHRYNGKEEQKFLNLPYTEYGARQLDPQTGRWFGIDPLAEKYYPIGQYVFCAGNPIKYVDPNGEMYTSYRNNRGEILFETADRLNDVIIVRDSDLEKFEEQLNEMNDNETIDDAEANRDKLHPMGTNLDNWSEKPGNAYPAGDHDSDILYKGGYLTSYDQDVKVGVFKAFVQDIVHAIGGFDEGNKKSGHYTLGRIDGARDRKNGILHKFNPRLKTNQPIIKLKPQNK